MRKGSIIKIGAVLIITPAIFKIGMHITELDWRYFILIGSIIGFVLFMEIKSRREP